MCDHSVSLESGLKWDINVNFRKMRVGWRNVCFADASVSSNKSAVVLCLCSYTSETFAGRYSKCPGVSLLASKAHWCNACKV